MSYIHEIIHYSFPRIIPLRFHINELAECYRQRVAATNTCRGGIYLPRQDNIRPIIFRGPSASSGARPHVARGAHVGKGGHFENTIKPAKSII